MKDKTCFWPSWQKWLLQLCVIFHRKHCVEFLPIEKKKVNDEWYGVKGVGGLKHWKMIVSNQFISESKQRVCSSLSESVPPAMWFFRHDLLSGWQLKPVVVSTHNFLAHISNIIGMIWQKNKDCWQLKMRINVPRQFHSNTCVWTLGQNC